MLILIVCWVRSMSGIPVRLIMGGRYWSLHLLSWKIWKVIDTWTSFLSFCIASFVKLLAVFVNSTTFSIFWISTLCSTMWVSFRIVSSFPTFPCMLKFNETDESLAAKLQNYPLRMQAPQLTARRVYGMSSNPNCWLLDWLYYSRTKDEYCTILAGRKFLVTTWKFFELNGKAQN